jgi:hypothetical protein
VIEEEVWSVSDVQLHPASGDETPRGDHISRARLPRLIALEAASACNAVGKGRNAFRANQWMEIGHA